jgi:hypothetical protein
MGQQINKVEKRRRRKSYLKRKHEASKALSAIGTVKKKTAGKKAVGASKSDDAEVKRKSASIKKKTVAKKKIAAPKTEEVIVDSPVEANQEEE